MEATTYSQANVKMKNIIIEKMKKSALCFAVMDMGTM